jgi:RNA:NAD 2'-phosphotransferase (TPT1/KptA family)
MTRALPALSAPGCRRICARHGHDLDVLLDFLLSATGCPDLSPMASQEALKAITAKTLSAGHARMTTTDDWLKQA